MRLVIELPNDVAEGLERFRQQEQTEARLEEIAVVLLREGLIALGVIDLPPDGLGELN